jgi:hypothetical protein
MRDQEIILAVWGIIERHTRSYTLKTMNYLSIQNCTGGKG